jgi:hypothetical protein
MANDLMTAELEVKKTKTELKVVSDNTTALAPAALSVDPLAAYADAVAPQYIVGEMLRFSKGFYYVGKKEEPLPFGTTFTVNPDELLAGWIKWFDSKPVEHEMVRVADHVLPKRRDELGDTDQSQWPADKTGTPKDPWQFTNYLPMMDDKGEVYTFTTSSRGGIGAIALLLRKYTNHRKRHPDVFPVITLNVDSYQHKDRNLGRIQFPVFQPAGYAPKTDTLAALAEAGHGGGVEPEPVEADPEDKMDDEIPF